MNFLKAGATVLNKSNPNRNFRSIDSNTKMSNNMSNTDSVNQRQPTKNRNVAVNSNAGFNTSRKPQKKICNYDSIFTKENQNMDVQRTFHADQVPQPSKIHFIGHEKPSVSEFYSKQQAQIDDEASKLKFEALESCGLPSLTPTHLPIFSNDDVYNNDSWMNAFIINNKADVDGMIDYVYTHNNNDDKNMLLASIDNLMFRYSFVSLNPNGVSNTAYKLFFFASDADKEFINMAHPFVLDGTIIKKYNINITQFPPCVVVSDSIPDCLHECSLRMVVNDMSVISSYGRDTVVELMSRTIFMYSFVECQYDEALLSLQKMLINKLKGCMDRHECIPDTVNVYKIHMFSFSDYRIKLSLKRDTGLINDDVLNALTKGLSYCDSDIKMAAQSYSMEKAPLRAFKSKGLLLVNSIDISADSHFSSATESELDCVISPSALCSKASVNLLRTSIIANAHQLDLDLCPEFSSDDYDKKIKEFFLSVNGEFQINSSHVIKDIAQDENLDSDSNNAHKNSMVKEETAVLGEESHSSREAEEPPINDENVDNKEKIFDNVTVNETEKLIPDEDTTSCKDKGGVIEAQFDGVDGSDSDSSDESVIPEDLNGMVKCPNLEEPKNHEGTDSPAQPSIAAQGEVTGKECNMDNSPDVGEIDEMSEQVIKEDIIVDQASVHVDPVLGNTDIPKLENNIKEAGTLSNVNDAHHSNDNDVDLIQNPLVNNIVASELKEVLPIEGNEHRAEPESTTIPIYNNLPIHKTFSEVSNLKSPFVIDLDNFAKCTHVFIGGATVNVQSLRSLSTILSVYHFHEIKSQQDKHPLERLTGDNFAALAELLLDQRRDAEHTSTS